MATIGKIPMMNGSHRDTLRRDTALSRFTREAWTPAIEELVHQQKAA